MSLDMLHGSLEENVLTVLCTNEEFAMRVALQTPPELFSNANYQKIARAGIDFLHRHQKVVGAHLRDMLEDDLRPNTQEALLLESYVKALEKLAPDINIDYVIAELDDFTQKRRLSKIMEAASDALHGQGDLRKALDLLYTAPITKAPTGGIWLSDPDAMLNFLEPREDDYFPSGIKELDIVGARPRRKQLFLIIGSKGIGKSWWLIQIGKHAILHHRSVLHITLELDEALTSQRYIQALYAYSTPEVSSIRVPQFTLDEHKRFLDFKFDVRVPEQLNSSARAALYKQLVILRQRAAPFFIKEFPTRGLTVAELHQYLLFLEREHKFRPDLLILDQAFNLRFDSRDIRLSMGQEVLALRGLGIERNMAIVTSWQGNRETDKAKVVTSGMIAEDWSLGGTADVICTISRTRQEKEMGVARVLVDKARMARDQDTVMVAQNYDTGQFCLESAYFNKRHYEELLDRLAGREPKEKKQAA